MTKLSATQPAVPLPRAPVANDGEAATVAFRQAVGQGRLTLPFPGQGATWARWCALAEFGQQDLSFARLAEGHTDALSILDELRHPAPDPGTLWGVWAAEPPGAGLQARRSGDQWLLSGTKAYCSGALTCTNALVTARAGDERLLFAIDVTRAMQLSQIAPVVGSWPAVGMAGSQSLTLVLDQVPGGAVGGPGAYLSRAGFWHGAVGVAAVWYGGAVALAGALLAAGPYLEAHGLAHLGTVDATLVAMQSILRRAASEIDQDPQDPSRQGAVRAGRARAVVEAGATTVMEHVGRALGSGPLCSNAEHGRRVADLTVYLRQSHAERDLAKLAEAILASGAGPGW